MKMKHKIIASLLLMIVASTNTSAQQITAPKQSKSILILNATAHLGNGKTIENSAIGFKDGKLSLVADATVIRIASGEYETTIDASGKHVYPGFIAPNSTLGLVEIDAVRSSDDEDEIGLFNPHVRSIVAYNSESKVVESVRPNGILIAQITPRGGRISGTSTVVQLDAWSWKDAIIKENDGIHMDFPSSFRKGGSWFEPGIKEPNKDYTIQIEEINAFLSSAKAYNLDVAKERNLVFEATKGLFNGTQTLFIHADEEKQIRDGIQLALSNGISKIAIVGGYDAYKASDLLLKHNIGVLLRRVHDMPLNVEQDVNLPYKLAKMLVEKGVVVGLENSGSHERMNTRNLPFLAGTCAAYGLDKEIALQLITLNTAKILGIDNLCGSLEIGKDATLFVSEGDALDMRTNKLTQAFIQGRAISLETYQSQLNKKFKEKYNHK
jgi:imidazolonepropionase-like amidohydrolase